MKFSSTLRLATVAVAASRIAAVAAVRDADVAADAIAAERGSALDPVLTEVDIARGVAGFAAGG